MTLPMARDPDFAYTNAPITEAVIEIRVLASEKVSAHALRASIKSIDPGFTALEPIVKLTGEIAIGPAATQVESSAVSQQLMGFQIENAEKKERICFTTESFSFHRLAPYEKWAKFAGDAQKFWGTYREIAKVSAISRIGVRYINRVNVPADASELGKFFLVQPMVPVANLGTTEKQFFQIISRIDELKAQSILNFAVLPPTEAGKTSVIIDIDLSRTPNSTLDDDAIWKTLLALRNKKNEIFESCLTDEARRMFA